MSKRQDINRVEAETVFEAPITHLVLPKQFVGKVKKTVTTPSVKNVERFITENSAPVTITDFLDGQDGQRLWILGDGQTTLDHGTKMFMAGGADLLLAADKVYNFIRMNGKWYQTGV